jgi:hypothetical protein
LRVVEKGGKIAFVVRETMIIRYSNGQGFDAGLLSETENSMRIAIQRSDDVLELKQINGIWVSEECEPVQVEFAWTRQVDLDTIKEDDCVCSPELAARLLHLLFSGEEEANAKAPATTRSTLLPVYQHVV